jgi:cytochrome c oxidase subunit 3
MAIFLASLAVLFAASIAGYLVVRLRAEAWPPPGMPRLPGGLVAATAILIACSVTIHLALASVRRGEITRMVRWLWVTTALGVLFLASQAVNWWGLVASHAGASANLYAFTFFMLTGLHAAHVVGGLIQLGFVTARARQGRYGSGRHPGVTYAAMYWHFLDAVWLVLLAVLVVFG